MIGVPSRMRNHSFDSRTMSQRGLMGRSRVAVGVGDQDILIAVSRFALIDKPASVRMYTYKEDNSP